MTLEMWRTISGHLHSSDLGEIQEIVEMRVAPCHDGQWKYARASQQGWRYHAVSWIVIEGAEDIVVYLYVLRFLSNDDSSCSAHL
jgi:hypothetical protein